MCNKKNIIMLLIGSLQLLPSIKSENQQNESTQFDSLDLIFKSNEKYGIVQVERRSGCFAASLVDYMMNMMGSPQPAYKAAVYVTSYRRGQPQFKANAAFPVKVPAFYDALKPTIIIIHGFMSSGTTDWVIDMKNAFLKWKDVNVLVVDWSGGAGTMVYVRAVKEAKSVGNDVGKYLKELIKLTSGDRGKFHCAGHSLGAHICAFASSEVGKFGRITGMDPAYPCFENWGDPRLRSTSAIYVDVIHTNANTNLFRGLGHVENLGVADFYPNGGYLQPGCANLRRVSDEFFDEALESEIATCVQTGQCERRALFTLHGWVNSVLRRSLMAGLMCNHGLATHYMIQSLLHDSRKCSYKGVRWKRPDTVNSIHYMKVPKSCSDCPEMGIRAIGDGSHPQAKGSYYVKTTNKKPYCLSFSEKKYRRGVSIKNLVLIIICCYFII